MTYSGNKALDLSEELLFEIGHTDICGVDIQDGEDVTNFENLKRENFVLHALTEPESIRHYVRLSRMNTSIDAQLYPLGSCTMKHNPRINEKVARMSGFANVHPLQPHSTTKGMGVLFNELSHWLVRITGMAAVALTPKAGAHGELCGMMMIKAAIKDRGETERNVVLIPASAHGTNPATAALLGFKVKTIPTTDEGLVDLKELAKALDNTVAAIMLTNPNTCGLFEKDVRTIADMVHDAGAYFYCDGANFNAIAGVVRPGDLGVDAMHINLHKTFSTPHGGGGPGAGPVVVSKRLVPYMPVDYFDVGNDKSIGRMCAFHGQMGMFTRAYTYMVSHGIDGVTQASKDAVLSANYIRACLSFLFTQPFGDRTVMHEVLFDDRWMKGTGVTTLDFAKALVDEGYHPMTVYFPLVVHGAMLIEPTESESKYSLDCFIDVMQHLAKDALRGKTEKFTNAPIHSPVQRLNEAAAARDQVFTYQE